MKFLFALLAVAAATFAEEPKISRIIYLSDLGQLRDQSKPFAEALPELGEGPLWDLRPFVAQYDIKLLSDDAVIWSPASSRAFFRASRQNIERLELLFEFIDDGYQWIDAEFIMSETLPQKVKIHPLRLIARSRHGEMSSLSNTNSAIATNIKWEPVSQADGQNIDLALHFKAEGDLKVDLKNSFVLKHDEAKTIWRSSDNRYELSVRLTMTTEPSVPEIVNDEELLKAINARLEEMPLKQP